MVGLPAQAEAGGNASEQEHEQKILSHGSDMKEKKDHGHTVLFNNTFQ